MERPETSIDSGAESHRAPRGARAIASGRIVDMGGIAVLLRAIGLRRAEAIDSFLCELLDHPGPSRLAVVFGPRPCQLPAASADESYDDLEVWRTRTGLLLRHGRVTARVTRGRASLGGDATDLREPLRYILPVALAHVLRSHGRIMIHGAAIEKAGVALVVLGGSGSGKSTAVLAALRSGWRPISDDMLLLRGGQTGVKVCGLPKPLAVPNDVATLTELACRPMLHDRRGRSVVANQRWHRGWHRVAGCLVAAHAVRSPGHIRSFSPSHLFTTALASFPGPADASVFRHLFPVAGALSRLPGWELCHDPDPAARLATSARLIDDVGIRLSDAARCEAPSISTHGE